MAIKLTADSFLNVVKQSGLIEQDQLKRYLQQFQEKGIDVEDSRLIADELVNAGVLTRWQADKLLQGKHKGFFLGKYKLYNLLGKGGMSSVYLAEHVLMRRRCAIKVLPSKRVKDSSYLARFHREAQAVASLDHANIVRAYDVDQEVEKDTEIHFLVMEYVDGQSMQDLVQKNGPLNYEEAADYLRQAADGLHHAHKAGLVHRDIKPGNLLVDKHGIVKILDLGLARFFEGEEENPLTVAHDEKVLGTADYLAPEQALDSHMVDIRADIYSLGCTIYYCLTGHPPFTEGTLAQRLMWHQTKQPPSIKNDRPDVPETLLAIIEKMMAKKPDDRQQTAAIVSQEFAGWLVDNAGDEWKQRHPGLAGSGSGKDSDTKVRVAGDSPAALQTPGSGDGSSKISAAAAPVQPAAAASPAAAVDAGFAAFLSGLDNVAPAAAPVATPAPAAVPVAAAEAAQEAARPAASMPAVAPTTPPPFPAPQPVVTPSAAVAVASAVAVTPVAAAVPVAAQAVAGAAPAAIPAPAAPVAGQNGSGAVPAAPLAQPAIPVAKAVTAQPVPTSQAAVATSPPIAPPVQPAAAAPVSAPVAAPVAPVVTPPPPVKPIEEPLFPGPPGEPVPTFAPAAVVNAPQEPAYPAFSRPAAAVAEAPQFPGFGEPAAAPDYSAPAFSDTPTFSPSEAPAFSPSGGTATATVAAPGTATRRKPSKQQFPLVPAMAGGVVVILGLVGYVMFSGGGDESINETDGKGRPAAVKKSVKKTTTGGSTNGGAQQINPNDLKVGAGGFATLGEALNYVKQNKSNFSTRREIKIAVAPGTYSERIAVDNSTFSFPKNVQFVCSEGRAVLQPSGTEPVIQIENGVEKFTLDGFDVKAQGRPVAIQISGFAVGVQLKNMKVEGFSQAGIRGLGARGIGGPYGDRVLMSAIDFHPSGADAVGIELKSGDQSPSQFVVQGCRFFGPMAAGVLVDADMTDLDVRESIFSETQAGIKFNGENRDLKQIVVGNNTFYKIGRGLVFTHMPIDGSANFQIIRNLFSTLAGPEAVIEAGYDEKKFYAMVSSSGGIADNWSDRKEEPDPMKGEHRLVVQPERQRISMALFASTSPSDAKYLVPAANSEFKSVPAPPTGFKPYAGAVAP